MFKKFTAVMLVAVMFLTSTSVLAESSSYGNTSNSEIQVILASAINGSPFTAVFDPETGRISMYSASGEATGYRYVEDEDAFWELVAINMEATSESMARAHTIEPDRINRNTFADAVENINESHQIAPRFDTGSVFMSIPQASSPSPVIGRSVLIGGRFFNTTRATDRVTASTFNLPSGMRTIDMWFTNEWGDDTGVAYDVFSNTDVSMMVRFPGEPYGVRVSSFHGSFNNVQLRLSSGTIPTSTVTLTFNPQGGFVHPTTITAAPGQNIGELPIPTRDNHEFRGWFTAQSGGAQITSDTIVPATDTTYFARWMPQYFTFQTTPIFVNSTGGVTRTNPRTFGTLYSHEGKVEVQFVTMSSPMSPNSYTVHLQALIGNTWTSVRTINLTSYSGINQRVTFTHDVGIANVPLRVHFTSTTNIATNLRLGVVRLTDTVTPDVDREFGWF